MIGSEIAPGRFRALYFTRATAPSGEGPLYHHIGVYAYRRRALARFVGLPPSPLERRERLEQLRALEAGMRIDAVLVDDVPFGVDTPDAARARPARSSRRPPGNHRDYAMTTKRISFQGEPGANSHIACQETHPGLGAPAVPDLRGRLRGGRGGRGRARA